MNNSKIALDDYLFSLDEKRDTSLESIEHLRERESIVIRIIEAIGRITESDEWSTLKKNIFGGRIESLEKQLFAESRNQQLNEAEMYRLQGRLFEATKYDLDKLVETYRVELLNIRKLTQPTER